MCLGCYQEYGSPVDITDQTPIVVDLLRKVSDDHAGFVVGGCHAVIEDWNLDDSNIDFALSYNDLSTDERACMMMLKEMTDDQRATALAIHDGFIKEETT